MGLMQYFGLDYDIFLLILMQIIVGILVTIFIIYLLWKYKESGKINNLPLYLVWVMISYLGALIFAVFSQILQEMYTETINQTEWGVITNLSITQCFFILAAYYQFRFNFEMFPTSKEAVVKGTGMITIGCMFINVVFPRYVMGVELFWSSPLKFGLCYIFIIVSSMHYVLSARRVSSIISNKLVLRRIMYINVMYILIMIAGTLFGIAWILETYFFYWFLAFYHLSFLLLMIGAFFGILAVRKASDEERKELVKSRQSLGSTGSS